MTLELSLLGAPRVERDGVVVTFDTRKATALLAHLALVGRPRPREALCELLWPRSEPSGARGALRRTLSTLRQAIGDEWLDTSGDAIGLRPGAGLDVVRFRELAAPPANVEELTDAAATYTGELLEGFLLRDSPEFEQWHAGEQEALRRELGSVLDRLVAELGAIGHHGEAVPHALRWLELDPLHEPAHRALIRLYALNGDRAAALHQYRSCVRTLTEELGVAPLEETNELYAQISEGRLGASEKPVPSTTRRAGSPPLELPLVGREAEIGHLSEAHSTIASDGHVAVIEGEAGVGKTRLAAELARAARARSALVLQARCYPEESGLPYGAVIELLRRALDVAPASGWPGTVSPQRHADAALLLPELGSLREGLPSPVHPGAPSAQARLLDAVATVLSAACSAKGPGVMIVDDVHAADEATIDFLAYLGRRLADRPVLLVLLWRSEGVPMGHRLRRLVSELAREGTATVVRPGRLDQAEVAQLVGFARPDGASADLERRIHLESEGLPLFVAEYLAAVAPADETMPEQVRNLLDLRLGAIGGLPRQILGAAAVVGRSFDLETARQVSGRSAEESVAGIEDLLASGIVRELQGEQPIYDFSHQKLRELVLAEMGLARRQLLHRRAASVLSDSASADAQQALVANHLRLAGDASAAAEHYVAAATHATSVLALADALEHLEAAIALGYPDPRALEERMGDLRTLIGDYAGALASYERAAALSDGDRLAVIEQKLGGVHHRRGEWDLAEARLRAALELARPGAGALRARVMADLSLTLNRRGALDAFDLARDAAAMADQAGDEIAQAQAHNLLGMLARSAGERETARTELARSLVLAEQLDNGPAQTAALNNLALVESDDGELDVALDLTERALALCSATGDRHREAALENNLADLHHAAGRTDDSMAHLKRAVTIFSEVGADEATRLPEIWKLVTW